MIKFNSKSFSSQIAKLAADSTALLEDWIRAFIYERTPGNLEEIKKQSPDYSPQSTKRQFRMRFSADPVAVINAIQGFGGGDSEEALAIGLKVIERVGIPDAILAEKTLEPKILFKLGKEAITKELDSDTFSRRVAQLRGVAPKSKDEDEEQLGQRAHWKARALQAEARIKLLEEQIKDKERRIRELEKLLLQPTRR